MHELAICILAAGGSKRLGTPKQLLSVHGQSLLQRQIAVANATGLPVYVVVNDSAETGELNLPITGCVLNPNWQQGLSSSIKSLVEQVRTKAWLFMTVDQYRLQTEHLTDLIQHWHQRTSGSTIIASRYHEIVGVPAIIPEHYRDSLLSLTGDQGAGGLIRQVQQRHSSDCIEVESSQLKFDVDIDQDLDAFTDYFQQHF